MSKRSRFLVILFVIALCFVFLWPSISWYGLTPKEDQALALGSLEKIKDYARIQASEDVLKIEEAARVDENAQLPAEFAYLEKIAKKNYKESGKKVPKEMMPTRLDSAMNLYTNVNSNGKRGILVWQFRHLPPQMT